MSSLVNRITMKAYTYFLKKVYAGYLVY